MNLLATVAGRENAIQVQPTKPAAVMVGGTGFEPVAPGV
jgi:hypothetical protein